LLSLQTASLFKQTLQHSSSSSNNSVTAAPLVLHGRESAAGDNSSDLTKFAQHYCVNAEVSSAALAATISNIYSSRSSSSSVNNSADQTTHQTSYSSNRMHNKGADSNSSSSSNAINSAQQQAAAAAAAAAAGCKNSGVYTKGAGSNASVNVQQHTHAAVDSDALLRHLIAGGDATTLKWPKPVLQPHEPAHENDTQLAALKASFSTALLEVYLSRRYKMCRQLLTKDRLPARLLGVQHRGTVFDPLANGICDWYSLMFISNAILINAMTTGDRNTRSLLDDLSQTARELLEARNPNELAGLIRDRYTEQQNARLYAPSKPNQFPKSWMMDIDAAIYAEIVGIKIASIEMTTTGYQGQYLGTDTLIDTSDTPIIPLALCLVNRNHWTVVALKSQPLPGEIHCYTMTTVTSLQRH
jgi:hypothetical protein